MSKGKTQKQNLKETLRTSKLTLDYVLSRPKKLFKELENVEIAILFDSIARDEISVHDIDIVLK